MALTSYRNAEFMNNEVPGVEIPRFDNESYEKAYNSRRVKKAWCGVEMIKELGNDIQGIQVSAPFGRIDLFLDVLGMCKNKCNFASTFLL